MKIALIIAYVLIAILVVIVIMEWMAIQKLITPPVQESGSEPSGSGKKQSDGAAPFGDMINAVKNSVKELEIKASF